MNSGGYEARFGVTPKDILGVVGAGACVALALWRFDDGSVIVSVGALAFFGLGGLALVVAAVRRRGKTALRVDADGVFLGALAFRGRSSELFVPWSQIGAVVLFRQQTPPIQSLYIGLDGKDRPILAPALRGFGSFGARFVPHVPPRVVSVSRPVSGWRLDRKQLERSVAAHAPEVLLVDLG